MRPTSDAASTIGAERGAGGDREELSTPRPSVAARRVLVTVCWLEIAGMAFVPDLRFFGGRVTALAFLVTVLGSVADLRTAFAFKEQLSHRRLHIQISKTVLVLLAACSIAGGITSIVPSMAYRSRSGDILYEYCVSSLVAPTLWGVILGTSISAIIVPSPRRLALASGASLVGWPLFLVIRLFCEPLIDFDDRFLLLVPWIVQLYVVAAFVASGLAIALAFGAARLAAEPVMQMPPKAAVVSQADRPRPSRRRPRAALHRMGHARPRADADGSAPIASSPSTTGATPRGDVRAPAAASSERAGARSPVPGTPRGGPATG